jgi:H+/Cl- antiporter ClcA
MLNLQNDIMCTVLVIALTISFLVNGLSAFSLLSLSFSKDSYDMLNDRARTLWMLLFISFIGGIILVLVFNTSCRSK